MGVQRGGWGGAGQTLLSGRGCIGGEGEPKTPPSPWPHTLHSASTPAHTTPTSTSPAGAARHAGGPVGGAAAPAAPRHLAQDREAGGGGHPAGALARLLALACSWAGLGVGGRWRQRWSAADWCACAVCLHPWMTRSAACHACSLLADPLRGWRRWQYVRLRQAADLLLCLSCRWEPACSLCTACRL